MSSHQRLESNNKQLLVAHAKADKLRQQLDIAQQEISILEAKGKDIEGGIIQGLMKKHSVSLEDVEKLLRNTSPKPKEPVSTKEPKNQSDDKPENNAPNKDKEGAK
ncbi:MAG: hypothetical protein FWD97_00465 [Defluviitaleaceae bacterium]|nr:hypothetical protein [Defluviitaleaceae bacterium]